MLTFTRPPPVFLEPQQNRSCQTGIFAGYWATGLRQRDLHSVPGCRTGCRTVCSPRRYGAVSVGLREYHCPKGIERVKGRSCLHWLQAWASYCTISSSYPQLGHLKSAHLRNVADAMVLKVRRLLLCILSLYIYQIGARTGRRLWRCLALHFITLISLLLVRACRPAIIIDQYTVGNISRQSKSYVVPLEIVVGVPKERVWCK